MKAVNAGEVHGRHHLPLLLVRATRPSPATNSNNTELHFFGNQDPGAFVSVSGGGVLEVQQAPGRGPAVARRT